MNGLHLRKPAETTEEPTQNGVKHDESKPRTDLLPPKAILEVARVLEFGAAEYGDNNWREVPDSTRRYTAAALRHIFQFMAGYGFDGESGRHSLAHAVASLLFVIEQSGDPWDFQLKQGRDRD